MKSHIEIIRFCILITLLFSGARQLHAHRSPENCGGAGVGIQVFKFRQSGTVANTITNGERVIYTVQIQNDAQLATPSGPIPVCDVTCASVIFRCPDFNGVPGPSVVLTNNLNLPFGTGPMIVGSVTCTVAVASGVASARARVEVIGIVHDVSSQFGVCLDHPRDLRLPIADLIPDQLQIVHS